MREARALRFPNLLATAASWQKLGMQMVRMGTYKRNIQLCLEEVATHRSS